MLFFQVIVIPLTMLALAKCAEPSKSKAESEKRLKRQLIDAFYSNPKFLSVFQNANPDDTLMNKFLGSDNRAEYTIDNGDYTFRIYMQQAPVDDEDYAPIQGFQGAYVEADDNDISNYVPNYGDANNLDTANQEDEETVKVDESEDLPNGVDRDENVDLQFITSKPSVSTPKPNVTPQLPGGQNPTVVNETAPGGNNNTSLYTHVDITGAVPLPDSIPVTEYVSVIKSVENMNLSKPGTKPGANMVDNNTLYVSPVLQNGPKPVPIPNPSAPAVKPTFDIPEIDHRILVPPPSAQDKIRNNTVNIPQVPKKETKPASSQTGANGQTSFLDNLVTYYLLNTFYNNNQDSRRTNLMPAWLSQASQNIYNALANSGVESSPNRLLIPRNGSPFKRDAPNTDNKIRPRSFPRY